MRILIVKLSALGDVIHTLPALTTLRRQQPGAEIHWLVEEASAELLEQHPALNRRWVLPRREWTRRFKSGERWGAVRAFLEWAREFRRERYDLVVDFQGLAKSAVWVALARARRKGGYGRGTPRQEGAWLALNERVPPTSPDVHALDRGLHLLEALGFPRLPVTYDFHPGAEREQEAERLLVEAGLGAGRRFVAVNPMTRWPTKDWEAGRFAATADTLGRTGVPVVFTGGPGDREAIDAIVARMATKPARLDGRTGLRVLGAVLQRAAVLLTTDTGPMHLAAAMGTPVVALFGPTSAARTGPYGPGHVVLRAGLACSPCFKRQCLTKDYEPRACMLRLEPDQVVDAVLEKWRSRESK